MANSNNPVRFGILGCAEIARKVCRAIYLSPNSILHAISSRSVEKARQFATKNSVSELVKVYGSYEEVLDDPLVDAVYVPLPTSLHLKWAVLAADKKKHVLLEKPTALDVGELDRILDACESNGVQFMDGSMWYHHPRTARMKELLSDPKVAGQVKMVVYMVWVTPRKLEKYLRDQGFNGNKYKFLFGDIKEASMISKHINLDDEDEVLPHIVAFSHHSFLKHGRNFFTWMGWTPRVIIMDPELIKDVFAKINDFQKLRSNPLARLLATGIVTYEGDKWIKHRKIIKPAFHAEKLKNMVPAFQLSCAEMLAKWEKLVSSKGSGELDVWPQLKALTSDVISRTAFGSSYEEGIRIFELITEQGVLAMEALQSLYIPGSRFLPTKRNLRMNAIDKEAKLSIRNIIDNRLKMIKDGKGNYDDLLGIMLESNIKEVELHRNKSHGMSIDEVIEECKLFYIAGQETTSSLLVWTMILLSKHQEWQSCAREEVFNVLIGDKNMDLDGLNNLKVVNMIFYEVLRLYPPVFGLGRKVEKEVRLGKFSLPSGIQIGIPTMLIHYDEETWGSDAKKFNPHRFSDGISKATKNRVIYLPFGWGPRICNGQNFALLEAKVCLAMILQRFSFEFSPSYVHAPHTVLTIQPQHGAYLILHKLK